MPETILFVPGRMSDTSTSKWEVTISGATVAYQVDWDSFGADTTALTFVDNVSCHRLNMALRVICLDDLGREAIRASLTSVRLANVADVAAKSLDFGSGTLTMRCAYAAGLDGAFTDSDIRSLLLAHI